MRYRRSPTAGSGSTDAWYRARPRKAAKRECRSRRQTWHIARSSRENSARAHEHQHDEEREREHIGQFGVGVITADGDDLGDDESGNKAANHVAKAELSYVLAFTF